MGCHMVHRYSSELAYANDLTVVSPGGSGLSVLISECERYAAEYQYEILFNGNESKLMRFRIDCVRL